MDFTSLAKMLSLEYDLVVGDSRFQLVELEFYLFDPDIHRDGFTHRHRRRAGEFRGHNAGFDITLQTSHPESYGGILIRSMLNLETGDFTNGPLRCLFQVLASTGSVGVQSLSLGLKKRQNPRALEVNAPLVGERIRLNTPQRVTPLDDSYKHAPYRFVFGLVPENKIDHKETLVRAKQLPGLDIQFCGYTLRT